MKKIAFIVSLTLFGISTSFAQYNRNREYNAHYGIDFSQINSGSGHGSGIAFNMSVQRGRKSLSFGLIYQSRENKISGADIRYRIFTGKYNENLYRNKIVRPYFQYNLLYKKATVDAPILITSSNTTFEIQDPEPGVIATMEHYASFGLQFKLIRNVYLDGSLGMGLYIGSLDKTNNPGTIGIHKENHGFTGAFKIGIGYRIN